MQLNGPPPNAKEGETYTVIDCAGDEGRGKVYKFVYRLGEWELEPELGLLFPIPTYEELLAQRDQLVAAVEGLLVMTQGTGASPDCWDKAREALEKVRKS